MADVIHRVMAVIMLDDEGKRIFTKYYDKAFAGKLEKQQGFEKRLFEKTQPKGQQGQSKEGADITTFDTLTVVFRNDPDVHIYVIGSLDENEIVLSSVLECLCEALLSLLKGHNAIEKRPLLENYDLLLLTVDETIDDGIILQLNSSEVHALVAEHAADTHDAAANLKQKMKETIFRK
eukprot:TRINITY_DN7980_c0_g1_i1.p1 TRINITY_DN7980_c0_g1~~TRINITY_DN7980_c0_g1_i1.p1  ORF type:complete len:199 (+),score=94.86 TRINITY_DN7980_c0_g1_i1:65-598(+)